MFNLLPQQKYNKFQLLINQINHFHKIISVYSDHDLKLQTQKMQKLLMQGFTLDEILPEAFGTAKEAIKRALGIELFNVQILGGIVLHKGKIAEMKTGEGKTLVAILPSYLNTLNGKGVSIITVNDYLAKRDAELVRKVFQYINIDVGLIQQSMNIEERKMQYRCNITYITNNELGFDYLRDNMAINQSDLVQKEFHFAIVDEVDSILIDEARTPLIISGPSEEKTNKYYISQEIVTKITKNIHYDVDEKTRNVILTEDGIKVCEQLLKTRNLYDINNPWIQYILSALKAKELFYKNIHYIIKNEEIVIVDEFTGRIMEGRRWSDGLHQAIEAKENKKIQPENLTLASITYQNLFLLYKKLSGMTGTAKTEETELDRIYQLEVEEIPTNKICLRQDFPDFVYKNEYSKWKAIANECLDMYKIGRPVLIGTTNVEKSEFLAGILNELKIPFNLLNAKPENIAREAEIITQAGRKGTITISTNMAGRGTDIILGGNPHAMTKIIIINYMKKVLKISSLLCSNSASTNKKINLLLQELNYKFIKTITSLETIEQYIEDEINSINLKNNDMYTNIQKVYLQILHEYKHICSKEKTEILKLGGLHVIGTERHESRRIDYQLKGRAGRQGDPGSSRFFLSLEDNLLRIFGGDKISKLMKVLSIDNDTPIESTILTKSLDSAQKKIESYFYDIRKQLFEYDEVINNQRQAIYSERKRILQSNFTRDCIIEYGESTIDEILTTYNQQANYKKAIISKITHLLNLAENIEIDTIINKYNKEQIACFLYEQLRITYDLRESYLEQLRPGLMRQLEKYYLLQQIDKAWQKHLEKMTLLKESIGWRSYGQQDPLVEYKNEGFQLFITMVTYIRQTVVYLTMRSRLIINTVNQDR
ncbi:preprotein translocase subunit A (plastid) [Chondrus crispus]|uniref:Protein translocase subunit SecA n=1 Tax=Chondrus crispus TaxID=2769 RepID=M5DC18_CHOCR|nr:preprotein translocase subunit A [Chondrus crispus]CCP38227.1 preprotein translocase subunit A [Chondrus crispus]|eukprot:YP_007627480.1 preprotein translocase subunit A (plastid) [Chondrus crispus]